MEDTSQIMTPEKRDSNIFLQSGSATDTTITGTDKSKSSKAEKEKKKPEIAKSSATAPTVASFETKKSKDKISRSPSPSSSPASALERNKKIKGKRSSAPTSSSPPSDRNGNEKAGKKTPSKTSTPLSARSAGKKKGKVRGSHSPTASPAPSLQSNKKGKSPPPKLFAQNIFQNSTLPECPDTESRKKPEKNKKDATSISNAFDMISPASLKTNSTYHSPAKNSTLKNDVGISALSRMPSISAMPSASPRPSVISKKKDKGDEKGKGATKCKTPIRRTVSPSSPPIEGTQANPAVAKKANKVKNRTNAPSTVSPSVKVQVSRNPSQAPSTRVQDGTITNPAVAEKTNKVINKTNAFKVAKNPSEAPSATVQNSITDENDAPSDVTNNSDGSTPPDSTTANEVPSASDETPPISNQNIINSSEGCDELMNGSTFITNISTEAEFYYELLLSSSKNPSEILPILEDKITDSVAPALIKCDESGGSGDMASIARSGLNDGRNNNGNRHLLSDSGVVGMASFPLDSIASGECSHYPSSEGRDCVLVNGRVTLYFKENHPGIDKESAKKQALSEIQLVMEEDRLVDPNNGIYGVYYDNTARKDASAAMETQLSQGPKLSAMGISMIVLAILALLFVPVFASTKKKRRPDANDEDGSKAIDGETLFSGEDIGKSVDTSKSGSHLNVQEFLTRSFSFKGGTEKQGNKSYVKVIEYDHCGDSSTSTEFTGSPIAMQSRPSWCAR